MKKRHYKFKTKINSELIDLLCHLYVYFSTYLIFFAINVASGPHNLVADSHTNLNATVLSEVVSGPHILFVVSYANINVTVLVKIIVFVLLVIFSNLVDCQSQNRQ